MSQTTAAKRKSKRFNEAKEEEIDPFVEENGVEENLVARLADEVCVQLSVLDKNRDSHVLFELRLFPKNDLLIKQTAWVSKCARIGPAAS
eukprot:scaffold341077_cov26-Attheya_sp.AAC.1